MTAVDDVDEAVAFLLRSTSARPQTEAELATKLRRRGVPEETARTAMARARDLGAVDDEAFARMWVEDRGRRRGFGTARLRQELTRRGVPDPCIEDALGTLDERDDLAVATELARRRAAQLPAALTPEAVSRRLAGYLQRRGHTPGLARRVAIDVSGLGREWD